MDCIYLNFHFLAAFNDGSDFKYPSAVIIFTWLKELLYPRGGLSSQSSIFSVLKKKNLF